MDASTATNVSPSHSIAHSSIRSGRIALFATTVALVAFLAPSRGAVLASLFSNATESVTATGPEAGGTLEDRVEVLWSTDESIPVTSAFHVTRNGVLVHIAASSESLFEDFDPTPDVTYSYCVHVVDSDGTDTLVGCDDGARVIARPTGFTASDGLYEDLIQLKWSDRSEIEAGYNVYRDAGNALSFDGVNDWVLASGIVDLTGSFTFEFWARRASSGTEDFVVNLEVNPNGDPVDVDMEIGFLADDRFVVGFGTDVLASTEAFTDTDWHHYAVAYDTATHRRLVFRDGALLVTDVFSNGNQPTGDLEFGRRSKQGPTKDRGHFDGQVDEIRLWDRALTLEEVRDRRSMLLSGSEAGLVGYWPMDVLSGLTAPDFYGMHPGILTDMSASAWTPSGAPQFRRTIGPDLTSYVDETAVAGFETYAYELAAWEDTDGSGSFAPAADFESARRSDTGWRGLLTPPGDVSATDGQFNDRVTVSWSDRSDVEEGYNLYRDDELLASVSAGVTGFTDLTPDDQVEYEYCVAAYGGGAESVRACDSGMAGGLPAPTDVAATYGSFDDRVVVSWTDVSDTEDGFEVYRDGELLTTVGEDGEEYNDLAALQGMEYDYSVRAFSKADPLDPAYSALVAASGPGMRAIILDPTELTATQDEFEDKVDLKWKNPSTTVMLFRVYRDDEIVQVLDFTATKTTDRGIPSDTEIEYCVAGVTVVATVDPRALQGQIAMVLGDMNIQDAIAESAGGTTSSVDDRMVAVSEVLAGAVAGKASVADALVESDPVCATGSRSMLAPTDVAATDNEYESHVQVDWEDNSQVESGYYVFRSEDGGTPVLLDSLSANRTTYGDYTGTPGVRFEYTVQAVDADGVSMTDSDYGLRTLEPATRFTATLAESETEVRLRWSDNSAAELGYRIYRRPVDGTFVAIGETGKNEPAFRDVPPTTMRGDSLQYRVVAFDDYGESLGPMDWGSTFIEAPANVNASDSYSQAPVVVVWVDRSNVEEGYRITRRRVGSAAVDFDLPLPANATLYSDDTVLNSAEYVYCVQAMLGSFPNQIPSDAVCDTGSVYREPGGGGGTVDPTLTALRIDDGSSLTSVGDGAGLRFGTSVAMGDGIAVIGAPGADGDDYTGGAFVFTFDEFNQWTRTADVYPVTGDDFGHAVDLSGTTAYVGDPVFGGYGVFTTDIPPIVLAEIAASPASGQSVAGVDSFVVVGNDQYTDANLPAGHGRVTVCNVVGDPDCSDAVDLALGDALETASAQYGYAVDVTRHTNATGDSLYVIAGAPGSNRAYVFECDLQSAGKCSDPADWTLGQVVLSPFGSKPLSVFGSAVSIDDTTAVVSARGSRGIAMLARTSVQTWDLLEQKINADAPGFGVSVAVREGVVVVGAPTEDVSSVKKAGTVYVYDWNGTLSAPTRYDARVSGKPGADAKFGLSVDIGVGFYLVGAPFHDGHGAAYSIPFGFIQPDDPVPPPEVNLETPTDVAASDGTAPDRIQIRWVDESDSEEGQIIYRSTTGGVLEKLIEVAPDAVSYDDFAAAPGEAYTYCVTAFVHVDGEMVESDSGCDIGWRPPNGAIAGLVATGGGAGTSDVEICLAPSPNRALLFDGAGGFVEAPAGEEVSLASDFTIEAWIRPHDATGDQYIVSKDSSYAVWMSSGELKFTAFESAGGITARDFSSGTTPSPGMWHHVAVTRDAQNDVRFYIDGLLGRLEQSEAQMSTEGRDTLAIGQQGDGTRFFNGEIDDVRIWNRALSQAEMLEMRLEMLTGEEENLVGNWPLDQGARLVAPDISESANHGMLYGGVYVTDDGAPLTTCAITGADGNFSIRRIRYEEATEFQVTAYRRNREFEPSFHIVSLTTESPVQNQVIYVDATAYTVTGLVQYQDVIEYEGGVTDTLSCPVVEVGIHVGKEDVPVDANLKTTSGADGSYAVAVDPSTDPTDTWFVMPRIAGAVENASLHSFGPSKTELYVTGDIYDVSFFDNLRYTLSGYFSGGDPDACHQFVGVATIRIYTQDGCYDRTIEVRSDEDNGFFEVDLPPLEYLVEVVDITEAPPEREDEIKAFFEGVGTIEVDMTHGDVERNLTFRAPLVLEIEGLEPPTTCPADLISQTDEEGNVLRSLPAVSTIEEGEFRQLSIKVHEDYGSGGLCPVDDGSVTIYDAIADLVDADSTVQIENGEVSYVTYGASPNIYSGARIGGVDRSFQKPFTVVAEVEGRQPLLKTEWAIVEGYRERSSTFVSATTEEFPLLILHDPPGSNSSAFLEKGSTFCNTISNTFTIGIARGVEVEAKFGFKTSFVTAPIGIGATIETGAGFTVAASGSVGGELTSLIPGAANRQICVSTTENLSTSSDMTWVGEDIHVGVALNLIFAIADVLKYDDSAGQCRINLSQTLAGDLDDADPFETSYAYGTSHIALSLIPELEQLIDLAGGDASVTGELDGDETTIRLKDALQNWKRQLYNNDQLQETALEDPEINRSFSAGTEFTFVEAFDTTRTTQKLDTKVYIKGDLKLGPTFDLFGWDTQIFATFEANAEWNRNSESTEGNTRTMGYTLSDGDTGDYFSVDIARDPRYDTFVFGTRSGRSSNPWESNTQKRDNPIVMVDPPVLHSVDPDDAGRFELTLINGSESFERRPYVIDVPGETNPKNLGVTVTGDLLGGNRLETFLLDPGKALTVNMDVFASPSAFAYRKVGLMIYPEVEMEIWKADPRQPFALSDTAFFSVFFDSTGGKVLASVLSEGWNWVSINRPEGEIATVLGEYPASQGDLIRTEGRAARYDSSLGWIGDLVKLVPGEAYHAKLANSGLLRITGDAVTPEEPLHMRQGWNWVGYLPARRMPVADALVSLDGRVVEGDAVVGQDGFAQYTNDAGWVGTLDYMKPGEAYALHLTGGGDLLYPPAPEKVASLPTVARETTTGGPDWRVDPERFDASMILVGEIMMGDSPISHTALKVAVTYGDEVRGIGEVRWVEDLDRFLSFVQIYGEEEELDDMRVHVYDGESDALYEDVGKVRYAPLTMLGQAASPVALDLSKAGGAPDLLDLPMEFALYPNYPNPFNPVTVIGYDLPQQGPVSLTVYDVIGRRVATLVNEEQPAGRHKVLFDGRLLASGLYLFRMRAGNFVKTGKMMLVK